MLSYASLVVALLFFQHLCSSRSIANDTEYPLYTIFDGNTKLSADDLKLIAATFIAAQAAVNASAAKLMHDTNSAIKLVHYTRDWEIDNLTDAEYNKTRPLRYSFGTLASALTNSASDTSVHVTLSSDFNAIPFVSSTASSDSPYSSNCTQFVSWIRIDDEYMKVTDINNDRLTVQRGFNGNGDEKPVLSSHATNATIFAPVLSGTAPGASDCDKTFAYLLNPESEYAVSHYAQLTFDDISNGLDGSWYDNWGATPAFPIDGVGDALRESQIWDDENADYFTDCNTFRIAQQNRLTAIYNELQREHKLSPNAVSILANNMAHSQYNKCKTYLFLQANESATPPYPYPLDGYCMEGYSVHQSGDCKQSSIAWLDVDFWMQNVNELIDVTRRGLAGMPMMAQAGCKAKGIGTLNESMYEQVMMFGYVTYLMGVDSRNTSAPFGVYALRERQDGQLYAYIDEIFYYEIGNPTQRKVNVSEYQINGHISYQRAFENGIVVINPNDENDENVKLSKQYINPQTNKTVQNLNVDAHTAFILFNQ